MLALVDEKPERDLMQPPEVVRFGSFSYVASVKAMELMSHVIEDSVIDSPGEVELYVSFQKLSRVSNQLERYTPRWRMQLAVWCWPGRSIGKRPTGRG